MNENQKQDHQFADQRLLNSLAKRIGQLVIECEMYEQTLRDAEKRIKQLENALSQVAQNMSVNHVDG